MKTFSILTLLLASFAVATPIPDDSDADSSYDPCASSKILDVSVLEIRGAHLHEVADASSRRQCCQACYKKKGCALYTYVDDSVSSDHTNFCRLTYNWDSDSNEAEKSCTEKITTGYEAPNGNGISYNAGAGPCGATEKM